MSALSKTALFWAPRALSIAFIAFLSLFALDVFSERLGFWGTALGLTMHLIPVFVMIGILALAWRWEWIGAVLYAAIGLMYLTWVVRMSRPLTPLVKLNWLLVVACPALVIAALFLANWLKRAELHTPKH